MSVVPFTPRAKRQSQIVDVLRELLALAEAGELDGFGACERRRNGEENIVLAGYFDANPEEALRACLDASIVLNQLRAERQDKTGTSH